MSKTKISFLMISVLSLVIFFSRILPHQPNLSPVLALFLFAGFLAKGRWYSMVLPLGALLASDLWIGFYPGWGFNYVSLVLILFSGVFISKQLSSFVGFGFLGAVNFFLVSNLGVWFFSKMYPPTFEGLISCYQMGIPFFRATLIGTTFFMVLFYLAHSFMQERVTQDLAKRV